MRPLLAKADTKQRAAEWSRAVFRAYGRVCWFHLRANPKSKVPATDPAHILKRSRMGAALAYGPKDGPVEPRLGRPLCREHHERQERGERIEDRFSFADVLDATHAHNTYAVVKLPLPEEGDYPA